jgi:hypothetical protein
LEGWQCSLLARAAGRLAFPLTANLGEAENATYAEVPSNNFSGRLFAR